MLPCLLANSHCRLSQNQTTYGVHQTLLSAHIRHDTLQTCAASFKLLVFPPTVFV